MLHMDSKLADVGYVRVSSVDPWWRKHRLAGDKARSASTGEMNTLRREACELKEVVAEQTSPAVNRWGRRRMIYLLLGRAYLYAWEGASEKLQIIRLVEKSCLPSK